MMAVPVHELSPAEYEKAVADLVEAGGHEVLDWRVTHLDPVDGADGTYVIDVTVRFRLLGADFLMLFECKRHAAPVKREHVQVLNDKLRATGAHKGVVVAASGFQRGALEYARAHGIACVRLTDDSWMYETRDGGQARGRLRHHAAYVSRLTSTGAVNVLLTDRRDRIQSFLFDDAPRTDVLNG
ncbi:restriction endonuclease [Actinomadura rubrisoli]|uniref:Restriction endonuclease n=1 Tax=Actinomadura rubrisoli TaxID=2530368 RepID=A0A4V2YR09_9ACTN|nr:restriction endonuclease [Actinomadura rubrisoli]TDD64267.1 restriction endonuclease [Actinomadura rubrisoli]